MAKQLKDPRLILAASLTFSGEAPATGPTPVKIVALTGEPMGYPGYGRIIFDLSTMNAKPRIHLDWDHDWFDSIGYLEKPDTAGGNGPLTLSGAIVPVPTTPGDKGLEVITKMKGGVPYEASVECLQSSIEDVPVGQQVTVNGRTIDGPVCVVRDWTLDAVAVCKFGKDGGTSALAAKRAKPQNPGEAPEGDPMSAKNVRTAAALAAAATAFAAGMAVKVGDKMGVVVQEVTDPVYEVEIDGVKQLIAASALAAYTPSTEGGGDPAAAPAAGVSASATGTTTPALAASKPVTPPASPAAPTTPTAQDPRAEFQRFAASFGLGKGAAYFNEGLTFDQAQTKFTASLQEENKALQERLKAAGADRGAEKPIKASQTQEGGNQGPKSLADVIRSVNNKK